MRAKTCSTRARTCLWDLLCTCFQVGNSSPLRRLWGHGKAGARVAAVSDRHGVADGGLGSGFFPCFAVVAVAGRGHPTTTIRRVSTSMTTWWLVEYQ